jgi:hypothetical protein
MQQLPSIAVGVGAPNFFQSLFSVFRRRPPADSYFVWYGEIPTIDPIRGTNTSYMHAFLYSPTTGQVWQYFGNNSYTFTNKTVAGIVVDGGYGHSRLGGSQPYKVAALVNNMGPGPQEQVTGQGYGRRWRFIPAANGRAASWIVVL